MSSLVNARELVGALFTAASGEAEGSEIAPDAWSIRKGSAYGFVFLAEDDKEPDNSSLYVSFRIMKVPLSEELSFYRRLLEINSTLSGRSSFSVDQENIVWLNAGRKVLDLSATELHELIDHTSKAADYYDDLLLDSFGRKYGFD